jgi:dihydrofolate reductase
MELITVAAVAENGVIGRYGDRPWPSVPSHVEQYRAWIDDWPVIVGRTTFEAMADASVGRDRIVLSRSDRSYDSGSVHHASGVDDALELVAALGAQRAYVIGGGETYEGFQPHVDRMVLTRIDGTYDGDTYFPEWNERDWQRIDWIEYDTFTLEQWMRSDGDGNE